MPSIDRAPRKRRGFGQRVRWMAAFGALGSIAAGCGSDATGAPGAGPAAPSSPASVDSSVTAVSRDQGIAQAALIDPDDLEGTWRVLGPEFFWPNSADLARTAPACVDFADLVFEGGARHGTGASVTLQRQASEDILFAYVVVFSTAEEAASMVATVESPEFDDCWSEFNNLAVQAMPYGITEATYVKDVPPEMTFLADSYVTRSLTGTVVVDGSELGDSCICVFAQVDRAVVEVHSAAEHLLPAERLVVTQAAIDKVRDVIG